MTIVVGYPPDGSGSAELDLAAMLSRTNGEDIVVCTVVPAPWYPGIGRIDAEYQAELSEIATNAIAEAQGEMAGDVTVTYEAHQARSVPRGLLEVAEKHAATLIVVGSTSAGPYGHVTLGSTTDRLLHSSHIPVVLATRGFHSASDRVSPSTPDFAAV